MLIHVQSAEYKYNRQAFDQKARSMTEKFARAGTSDFGDHDQEIQALRDSREGLVEAKESKLPNSEDHFVNRKRSFGLTRKLSLDAAGHGQRHSSVTTNEVPLNHTFNKQMEVGGVNQVMKEPTEYNLNQDKVQQSTKKLASELAGPSDLRNGGKKDYMAQAQSSTLLESESILLNYADIQPLRQAGGNSARTADPSNGDMRNVGVNESTKKLLLKSTDFSQKNDYIEKLQIKPQLSAQLHSTASCQTLSFSETPGHNNNHPHKNPVDQSKNGFSTRYKKLGLTGRKHSFSTSSSSQGQQKGIKENVAPSQNLPLSYSDTCAESTSSLFFTSEFGDTSEAWTGKSTNPCGTSNKLPLQALEQIGEGKENSVQFLSQAGKHSAAQVNHRILSCEDLCGNKQHRQPNQEEDERVNRNIKQQEKGSPKCEATIVLDSEDSEDERNFHKRSKLLLARKRLPGKRKA